MVDFSTEESVVDVDDIADFLMKDNERSLLGIKVFGADDALPIVLGDALGPNLLVDPSAFVKRTSLVEDELEATAEDDKVFSDVSKGDDVVAMLPMNSFDDFEAPMMENDGRLCWRIGVFVVDASSTWRLSNSLRSTNDGADPIRSPVGLDDEGLPDRLL